MNHSGRYRREFSQVRLQEKWMPVEVWRLSRRISLMATPHLIDKGCGVVALEHATAEGGHSMPGGSQKGRHHG